MDSLSVVSRSFYMIVLSFNLGVALVFALSNTNTITAPASLPTEVSEAATLVQRQRDPAIACWSSWSSYRSLSTLNDLAITKVPTTLPTYVETIYNVETVDYSNATYTALCAPDVHYSWITSRLPTTTLPTSCLTYYDYETYYAQSTQTAKPPACTYSRNSSQCSRLWSSWSISSSALVTATATDADAALSTLKSDGLPPCIEPEIPCPSIVDRKCTVKPDSGTFYYWPVTTVSGDFCAQNGTTITPTPTKKGHPNTIILGDNTFTSPSVYLVLSTVNGYYSSAGSGLLSRNGKCGPTLSDVILTLPPSAVSSVRFVSPDLGYQVNYADFNLVPLESYKEACPYLRACSGWGTSGIKNYQPFLQVPHEVLRAQWREWSNCTGWAYVRPSLKVLQVESTTKSGTSGGPSTARPSQLSSIAQVTARPTSI